MGKFEDERGVIEDILTGPLDYVTRIITKAGAVRGNHVHGATTQWVYIVSGRLLIANARVEIEYRIGHEQVIKAMDHVVAEHTAGALLEERPMIAHAWKALEDTTCLVLTRGPGSGENYEQDVIKLPPPGLLR